MPSTTSRSRSPTCRRTSPAAADSTSRTQPATNSRCGLRNRSDSSPPTQEFDLSRQWLPGSRDQTAGRARCPRHDANTKNSITRIRLLRVVGPVLCPSVLFRSPSRPDGSGDLRVSHLFCSDGDWGDFDRPPSYLYCSALLGFYIQAAKNHGLGDFTIAIDVGFPYGCTRIFRSIGVISRIVVHPSLAPRTTQKYPLQQTESSEKSKTRLSTNQPTGSGTPHSPPHITPTSSLARVDKLLGNHTS